MVKKKGVFQRKARATITAPPPGRRLGGNGEREKRKMRKGVARNTRYQSGS